jgi:hypothetical protein
VSCILKVHAKSGGAWPPESRFTESKRTSTIERTKNPSERFTESAGNEKQGTPRREAGENRDVPQDVAGTRTDSSIFFTFHNLVIGRTKT